MKTGELLKKNLGLENFKFVKINRAIVSSYKILFVWYDSYRKNMPITNYRVKKGPLTAHIFSGVDLLRGTNKKTPMTPLIDIEQFNGELRNALIIPVDLGGDKFITDKDKTIIFEGKQNVPVSFMQRGIDLLEWVTLYDLKDVGNVSDFTQVWRKDRNRVMGTENVTAKLIDCTVNESEDFVTFGFLTSSTELGNKNPNDNIDSDYRFYTGEKGEVDPETFEVGSNSSNTYEVYIRIINFFEWLDTYPPDQKNAINEKELKKILQFAYVQIWSTSPSFHWQGFNYWLSQIDASMYPTDIKPKRWNAARFHGNGQSFLDKHSYGLLRQIDFFLNPMASMLTKKLKDLDIL